MTAATTYSATVSGPVARWSPADPEAAVSSASPTHTAATAAQSMRLSRS